MKVYESSHPTQRDYTRLPQIKIKNKKLFRCGFEIGKEFEVIYEQNKIICKIKLHCFLLQKNQATVNLNALCH